MALYEKRLQARKLRRQGKSVRDISSVLKVSKGSVSLWCADIILTKKQIDGLMKGRTAKTHKGRLIGAAMNKQKKIDAIISADEKAFQIISSLQKRELLLIATALYWAEGSKSDSSSGYQFVNSDPIMILCIKKMLLENGVENKDLFCTIQINITHKPRIKAVLKYWKNLLELNSDQIGNPSFVKTTARKVYDNHETYMGICRLKVRKSTALKYSVLGLIKAIKRSISMPV